MPHSERRQYFVGMSLFGNVVGIILVVHLLQCYSVLWCSAGTWAG